MSGTSAPVALGAHDDARRVDALDDAGALARRRRRRSRRASAALHAGADERRVRADERHGLALHVGAHERAVRVVVLEERHERGGDRHHLVRRDVHQLDHLGRDHLEVAVEASGDEASRGTCPSRRGWRWPGRCTCPLPRAREYQLHLVGDACRRSTLR